VYVEENLKKLKIVPETQMTNDRKKGQLAMRNYGSRSGIADLEKGFVSG
jgi:hypothetical protein